MPLLPPQGESPTTGITLPPDRRSTALPIVVPRALIWSFDLYKRQLTDTQQPPNHNTAGLSTLSQPPSTPTPQHDANIPHLSNTNPTNTPRPHTNDSDNNHHKKAIVFGIAGAVTVLLILSLLLYHIFRRHRVSKHTTGISGRTGDGKGDAGVYTPVQDDSLNQGSNSDAQQPQQQRRRSGPWWWWWQNSITQSRSLLGGLSSFIGGKRSGRWGTKTSTSMSRRERQRTLYKVRRQKPGGSFEIDSEITSSTTDLNADVH